MILLNTGLLTVLNPSLQKHIQNYGYRYCNFSMLPKHV